MRRAARTSVLLLAGCHGGMPAGAPPIPMPTEDFATLLSRATAQDTTLDFQALRIGYTTTTAYEPYGTRDSDREKSLVTAIEQDSFALALSWADSLLRDNPVTPNGHAAAAYAANALNDSNRAEHHRWMAIGLMESIRRSGEGTEASPMIVIAVYEEYALARYMGLQRLDTQGLGECGGHPCDAVGFRNPRTERDTTLHFDVSIPVAHLERSFHH